MSETFQCGDYGAIVSYLYDECAPDERESIAAHLARCTACAGEVSGLVSTRRVLAAWAPPEADLALQITRKVEAEIAAPARSVLAFARPGDTSVERTTPWWKAPLPAWAQAAAAVAIFAAGLSVGFMRNSTPAAATPQTVNATPAPSGPSKADLVQLEQTLRAEMAQLSRSSTNTAPAPTPVIARSDDEALMQRVQTMIEESERRQNIEMTERFVRQNAQLLNSVNSMRTAVGQLQGQTGELRQGFSYLANQVSQQK